MSIGFIFIALEALFAGFFAGLHPRGMFQFCFSFFTYFLSLILWVLLSRSQLKDFKSFLTNSIPS